MNIIQTTKRICMEKSSYVLRTLFEEQIIKTIVKRYIGDISNVNML